jgi:fatty acid desaturase (delta-4 desaturase)
MATRWRNSCSGNFKYQQLDKCDAAAVQATLDEEIDVRDWGVQQVLTSANWGGVIGNFFTGGLNLQVCVLYATCKVLLLFCSSVRLQLQQQPAQLHPFCCLPKKRQTPAACLCLLLQIEHHLFPAISFMHYPAISKIVEDECNKRGIQYAHYDTLPEILARFSKFMQQVGEAEQTPARGAAAQQLAKL